MKCLFLFKGVFRFVQGIGRSKPVNFYPMDSSPIKTEKPNSWKKLLGVFLKFCKIVTTVAGMVKAVKGLFF